MRAASLRGILTVLPMYKGPTLWLQAQDFRAKVIGMFVFGFREINAAKRWLVLVSTFSSGETRQIAEPRRVSRLNTNLGKCTNCWQGKGMRILYLQGI